MAASAPIDVVFHCEANGVVFGGFYRRIFVRARKHFPSVGQMVRFLGILRFSAFLRFYVSEIAHIIKREKNVNEKREKRTTMKDYSLKTVRHLTNEQRTELAMLLRYRTQPPKEQPRVYATLKQIAETLCRSISWV